MSTEHFARSCCYLAFYDTFSAAVTIHSRNDLKLPAHLNFMDLKGKICTLNFSSVTFGRFSSRIKMTSSALLQEKSFSTRICKEKLQRLDVKFPDIKLDADRCHPLCLVSPDQRSLTFSGERFADVSETVFPFHFLGTCGTQALSGRVFWQVRIRINKPKEFALRPFSTLAEIGLATLNCLLACTGTFSTGRDLGCFSVKLCTNGKCLVARTSDGISAHYVEFLTGLGELDGKIGFFLDTFLGEVMVIDVTTRRVLFVCSKKLTEDLYPVINLVQDPAVNNAEVCLTVESGVTLAMSKEMVDIFCH